MDKGEFSAEQHAYRMRGVSTSILWLIILMCAVFTMLFLPWTQNIRARGVVTTLRQEHRPQEINALIAGRIEAWFVKEGDQVKSGDTILKLSEISTEYLDPALIERTNEQLTAKENSIDFYNQKIKSTNSQIQALSAALESRIGQLQNKVLQAQVTIGSDSMQLVAASSEWQIASAQFNRQQTLYDSGLVSLTQLEQRRQSLQVALAKKVAAENKLAASRQELQIRNVELTFTRQDYKEKVSKTQAEKMGVFSSLAGAEQEAAALRSRLSNYNVRAGMYYVTAPQDGQINKAKKGGVGETVKAGDMLASIVPDEQDHAVEVFIRPVDLPLVSPGQTVRFLFDGFPAIVFSGWPNASYGTYQGIIYAVENNRSENGLFRMFVKEDKDYRPWPDELRIGTGASSIALLKTVPVWYELWRLANGFPQDYYHIEKKQQH